MTLDMGVVEAKTDARRSTPRSRSCRRRRPARPGAPSTQVDRGFKLREGMAVGARVTLRGARMYEFLDRLVSIALPRIRDFRGLDPSRSTAAATTGWNPRADHLPRDRLRLGPWIRGLDIAITTTAETDEQAAHSCARSACRSRREKGTGSGQEVAHRQAGSPPSTRRGVLALQPSAARAPSSRSSASAGSACASSRTRARSPA